MERSYYLIIALFFTVLIAWGSFLPSDEFEVVTFNMYDKIVHLGAYTIFAFSWFIAIRPERGNLKMHLVLILGTNLYGIIIEIFHDRTRLVVTGVRAVDACVRSLPDASVCRPREVF